MSNYPRKYKQKEVKQPGKWTNLNYNLHLIILRTKIQTMGISNNIIIHASPLPSPIPRTTHFHNVRVAVFYLSVRMPSPTVNPSDTRTLTYSFYHLFKEIPHSLWNSIKSLPLRSSSFSSWPLSLIGTNKNIMKGSSKSTHVHREPQPAADPEEKCAISKPAAPHRADLSTASD